jgi:hypothetical protein
MALVLTGIRCKALSHLHQNRIRSPVNIRCSKAKQAKADPDEAVLATIVINQPITVIAAVVFDCQPLKAIEQVRTTYETALTVMDGNLNLRPRKSGKHEQHPQPGLHWGLGLRLGQVNNVPKPSDAFSSRMICNIIPQLGHRHELCMKKHVCSDDSLR